MSLPPEIARPSAGWRAGSRIVAAPGWRWAVQPAALRLYAIVATAAVVVLILAAFALAIPYREFDDEYANLAGGRFILAGQHPYTGFFVHHMPLLYYLGAGLFLVGQGQPWAMRAAFLALLAAWLLVTAWLLRRHGAGLAGVVYLGLVAVSLVVYWGHMVLAETLVAQAAATLLALFSYRYLAGRAITRWDAIAVSVLVAIIALSSLGYFFVAAWAGLAFLIAVAWQRRSGRTRLGLPLSIGVLALPYATYLGILVATGGLNVFVFDTYTFNVTYLAPYVGELHDSLPALLGMIGMKFATGLRQSLQFGSLDQLPLLLPVVALGVLTVVWLMTGRVAQVAFALPFLIALNTRGGLGQPWLNNFHGAPFIVVSLLVGSLALFEVVHLLRQRTWARRAIVAWALLILLAPVMLGTVVATARVSAGVWRTTLAHGTANTISNAPSRAARAIDELSEPTDAVWVGPFDHETWLGVDARLGSRYVFVLPWVVDCEACVQQLLDDFATNRPKMIVWYSGSKIWDLDIDEHAAPIVSYLRQHYFRVANPNKSIIRHFYFPRERRAEIMAELREKGYVD